MLLAAGSMRLAMMFLEKKHDVMTQGATSKPLYGY